MAVRVEALVGEEQDLAVDESLADGGDRGLVEFDGEIHAVHTSTETAGQRLDVEPVASAEVMAGTVLDYLDRMYRY